MRCTYALNRPRCILLLLEENKRPWAKAVHAEPSPLVINNIPWPLKAQRCESFLLNHCSDSCNRSVSGLCVAKPSQTLIMWQKTCNRTTGSALVFYTWRVWMILIESHSACISWYIYKANSWIYNSLLCRLYVICWLFHLYMAALLMMWFYSGILL